MDVLLLQHKVLFGAYASMLTMAHDQYVVWREVQLVAITVMAVFIFRQRPAQLCRRNDAMDANTTQWACRHARVTLIVDVRPALQDEPACLRITLAWQVIPPVSTSSKADS